MRLAILTMALGAFAIGLTEFAVTGLLPQIAADLAVSIPAAGNLVTAYAIGVVVGAPLLTAMGARLSQRTLLLVFMGLFALGNGLAAAAPDFGTLLVARFLSGLPHGAFFGVAGLLAAQMGGARRASAVGRLFLGLTVANLVGVPAATVFGGAVGWRPAFALIAAIALLCVGGMAVCVPRTTGRAAAGGLRAEFAALRSPAVSLALAMVVLGCGGLFTFATYIAPMTTEVTGWPAAAVPVQLAVLGLGMTVGTFLGGRLADRVDSRRAVTLVLGAQSWPCSPPSPPCTCRCWPPSPSSPSERSAWRWPPWCRRSCSTPRATPRCWRPRPCSPPSTSRTPSAPPSAGWCWPPGSGTPLPRPWGRYWRSSAWGSP